MRRYFIILLFFISALSINGQGIRFSFLASPQFSWFNPETKNIENKGIKTGSRIGLQIDNFFTQHYAFSSGFFLNSAGGKLQFNEETVIKFKEMNDTVRAGGTLVYRLDYFSVPLGLKLTTREIGYSTFWLNLGGNANVRFKTRADLPSSNLSREILRDEINLFGFSYYLGAGVKYSIGGQTALIGGLTYHGGLTDVLLNKNLKTVNNSLTIEIGILF